MEMRILSSFGEKLGLYKDTSFFRRKIRCFCHASHTSSNAPACRDRRVNVSKSRRPADIAWVNGLLFPESFTVPI